jgi:hypothetical protein
LLRNDTQDFQQDSVEFVKTTPCPRLGQSFEKFTHGFVIKFRGTIQHHALNGARFGQIFGGFGFTRPGWTRRCLVHHCLPLFTIVYHCLPLFTIERKRKQRESWS